MGFGYLMYPHSLVPIIDPWGSGRDNFYIKNILIEIGKKKNLK